MKQLVLAVLLVGCAGAPKLPTIAGGDLHAHAAELREHGQATVRSNRGAITIRRDQYLIATSRDQVFSIGQVVEGCHGGSLAEDVECTAALLHGQRFAVVNTLPERPAQEEEGDDISSLNKARIVVAAAGVAMVAGAVKCDAFDGCSELLTAGAVIDGTLLLLLLAGPR